ncbi:MAG: high-potential iron-sulfur protein [Xanthomonadales bacterium]|nr:high-potential iron-sulfur protein [Xanthomonadales bacterium]
MNTKNSRLTDRRRFLSLVGGSVSLLTVAGVAGCSGDKDAPAAAAPEPEATPAAEPQPSAQAEPAPQPAAEPAPEPTAQAPAGDLVELSEQDTQATALGYVHDAANVDTARYPQFQPGQACVNCVLYQGGADDAWAGCSIFIGKKVNAKGWCSAYAPKAG